MGSARKRAEAWRNIAILTGVLFVGDVVVRSLFPPIVPPPMRRLRQTRVKCPRNCPMLRSRTMHYKKPPMLPTIITKPVCIATRCILDKPKLPVRPVKHGEKPKQNV